MEWEERIEAAKADGCKVITPNNLPITTIKCDGTMLECEHGDHPDYKFPVCVDFIGDKSDFLGPSIIPEDIAEALLHQHHALIYADRFVAITMYECCYAMWYWRSGDWAGGSLWDKEYKLSEKAIADIGRFVELKFGI